VKTDPQSADFPEAKQFLKSRNRTRFKNAPADGAGAEANEDLTRHFVTSWSMESQSAQAMAQIIRAHWCCESKHWQRDACWQEDKCRIRNANAACALALIRTALQSLIHWAGRHSLPTVFEDVAHDLTLGLAWLKNRHLDG